MKQERRNVGPILKVSPWKGSDSGWSTLNFNSTAIETEKFVFSHFEHFDTSVHFQGHFKSNTKPYLRLPSCRATKTASDLKNRCKKDQIFYGRSQLFDPIEND